MEKMSIVFDVCWSEFLFFSPIAKTWENNFQKPNTLFIILSMWFELKFCDIQFTFYIYFVFIVI